MKEFIKYEDVKNITAEKFFNGSEFAISAFKNKYPLAELNETTPAHVFNRVAKYIASAEETDEAKEYWYRRWFHEMWTGVWVPAGSILNGAANPNKVSLANCTTLRFGEGNKNGDSLEDIHDTAYAVSKTAAYRQGLGVLFDLRPAGMPIHNSSRESQGNTHWMKYINNIGNYVGQKGRIPAMLFAIKDHNPDLEDFITVKSDQETIANANISVHWSNLFMRAVKDDENWTTTYNVNGDNSVKVSRARSIFDKFVKNNWGWGEPGAQFIDNARYYSNSDYLGDPDYFIVGTNACSEQFLESAGWRRSAGLCVLASVNYGNLPMNIEDAIEYIRTEIAPSMNRFLDNVITKEIEDNRYAIPGQLNSLKALRRVGAGITNLDGYLIKHGIGYDTEEGHDIIFKLTDALAAGMYKSSQELGAEKGNFELFDRDLYTNAPFVKQMMERYGYKFNTMRNCCLTSIAPTGTLSLMFQEPAVSYGIEPVMGFYYWKRHRTSGTWEWLFVVPSFVREHLKEKGINLADYGMNSESVSDPDGSIGEKIAGLIDEHFPTDKFKPAHKINPFAKADLMAKLNKYCIDSAISVTYNLPEDVTEDTIRNLYIYGWEAGLKSMSIYRDKSRAAVVEFESPKNVDTRFIPAAEVQVSLERPKDLYADVYHTKALGEDWVVFVGKYFDKPYEVFAGKAENINISRRVKSGKISKVRKAYFFHPDKSEDKITLTKDFMEDQHEALTRMVSLNLRHGTPVQDIIDQLEKSYGSIVEISKAVSRVLKKYLKQEDIKGKKCQGCGSTNLQLTEGCFSCLDCGMSKCS